MAEGSRSLEDKYFAEKEAHLRRMMREKAARMAAEQQSRRKLASHVGLDQAEVIDRLHSLGLDGEVGEALFLMPLVGVAWADDEVTHKEREAVLRVAEAHGIEPGTPPAIFLASILEERPSAELRDTLRELLREMLRAKGLKPRTLLEACEAVAKASGGLLGLGIGNTISDAERAELEAIAAAAGPEFDRKISEALE